MFGPFGSLAGVLLAWDEDRPRLGGAIVSQFVPRGHYATGGSEDGFEVPAANQRRLDDKRGE